MRYGYTFALGLSAMLLACSGSGNSYSYRSYGEPSKCWISEEQFAAYVAVYDLGNGEYTFDLISKRCKPKDFEIGQPPTFVVSFSPSKDGEELESLGITGKLLPNQISPLPSIEQIIGVYSVEGSANLDHSQNCQLRISYLTIRNSTRLNTSPIEFLREHVL
ncbi:hypothetical protein [Alteraurantiacibacter aestuarii]|uniref:Lipoprotein n=1 Tax=Alteraurantiacibacter aestuarii TaxID=650004 RepID=A0A844ZK72_9SPHN|nr:hypothetical protein [Alteraurantiacibacter aestuarii]MXO88178.1 hypothetical protein [Alteraurantiacibacter aestuarii]